MSLLTKKKAIGWDIGSSGLRAVELEQKDGRIQLKNFAHLNFKNTIDLTFQDQNSFDLVTESIRKVFHKAKFSTLNSYAVIPGFYSYNKVFNFNSSYSDDDINNWLYKNISRNSFANNNILLDWQLISKKIGTKKVYASAVAQDMIQKYKRIFRESELKLVGIETSYHSLIRSIFGNDNTDALIIDVGDRYSDLTIVEKNIPTAVRSVRYGGMDVTNAISQNLNINYDQAEQIKKDAQVVDNNTIQRLKDEITKLMNEYNLNGKKNKPDKIMITGGELKNQKNCELFKKHFKIDTYLANPWGRILYHQDLKNHLDTISPNFAIAIGSAMKML